MSDLIERDKAIEAIRSHIKDIDGDDDALDYIATNMLKDVPSARPKGEWISNHDGSWNCSECGLRVFIYAKGNYCPNCGSDNRERNDDE